MTEKMQKEIEERRREQFRLMEERIRENLSRVERRIVVFSGKGGVGKTTVAVNLAYSLVKKGYQVGLLDADVTGPNVPKMVGLQREPTFLGKRILPLERRGLKVISIGFFLEEGVPVIWRGPLRSNLLQQFLSDVEWGNLDFLLADLPPGTGDEVLTMAQKMQPEVAIIVTTPQEIALADTRRAAQMALKLRIPKLLFVENMSGFVCPHCGHRINIFDEGGGRKEAEEFGGVFLGQLPLDVEARKGADRGEPVVVMDEKTAISKAFFEMADRLVELCEMKS